MKTATSVILPSTRAHLKLLLAVATLGANYVFAATEQWQGGPGVSASLNWTDPANWTAPKQTYYNQVQFLGTGANAVNDFTVNNILDAATGVAQMPIWELDYMPTNGNYVTLINPGVTLTLGAGWGSLYVGADIQHSSQPAPANAVETIRIEGVGGALNLGGNLYLGQGSVSPNDAHNVTLDLSGLDHFTHTGSQISIASGTLQHAHGVFYLARTNQISLGNDFQISSQNYSNSLPVEVYLGQANNISLGSGNLVVGGTGTTAAGAWIKFNPTFLPSVPTAYFHSSRSDGRIANFWIANGNGGPNVPGTALADFTGGSVALLVDSLQLGRAGTASATGVLALNNGLVDVNNATIGNQQVTSGGAGVGFVNLNSGSGTNATLRVNGTLTLAAATGTLTPGTAGTINVNGGALAAGNIVNGGGAGTINLSAGALTVGGSAGTLAAPLTLLATTNSSFNLALAPGASSVVVNTLRTGGTTNLINIVSAPPLASYPTQLVVVKYSGSIAGAGFNFGLGTLPPLFAGYLVNNTANGSIDVVLTTGSTILTWAGNVNGNWDTMTANWLAGGAATYTDGQFVRFQDGATTANINLTTALSPSSITVSNNSQGYTFGGVGSLVGTTGLVKDGAGRLILNHSGDNNFTGGVTINNGALQIGNNDNAGNLPAGSVVNHGNLTFARSDSITVANSISGTGSFTQAGAGGTLLLSGGNSYAGNVLVTNNSTLVAGSASALGASSGNLIIASGSTFDLNGYASPKPIIVSGAGVDGAGAIVDSGGAVYGIATSVTLAGNTTFSLQNRWDLTGSLNTGGNAYDLTLLGAGYFEWRNLSVDSALGNLFLQSGQLGIVGSTSLGNPARTLTLSSGAAIVFYGGPFSSVNKNVDFQSGGNIFNYGGNNIMSGTMTLEPGFCSFDVSGGTSLTLSNVLTGSGVLYQNNGSGTIILAGNSPAFTGGVLTYNGAFFLNGTIGSGITSQFGTVVGGTGTATGLVGIGGALVPGGVNVVGTFHAQGGLVLEGGAVVTNDLAALPGPNNDLVQVIDDLTANGNDLYINPIGGSLANASYPLFTYTGNLIGSFGNVTTIAPTAYTLVLTNVTTTSPKEIRVIVSGSQPRSLVWNNASSSDVWDVQGWANWSNLVTHTSPEQFLALDAVLFSDAGAPSTSIDIPALVVPSVLTVNASVDYNFAGNGAIGGTASLVKQGGGTLNLAVAGSFSGAATISGGTVKTIKPALNSVSSLTITNGGTLDFSGNAVAGNKSLTLAGAGVGGRGALVNNSNDFYNQVFSINLVGDATIGGSNRWDLVSGATVSGPHKLTIQLSAAGGYQEWDSVAVGSDVSEIELAVGNLGIKNMSSSFANPNTVLTVNTNCELSFWSGGWNGSIHVRTNGRVNLWTAPSAFTGGNIILDEGAHWLAWSGSGPQLYGNAVTLNGVAHLLIGDYSRIYTNVISGPGGMLIENWNQQMVLSAANTYTGPTIIANGPQIALTNNGSISHSALLFFGGSEANSVHIDVSGRGDKTLTLASGQTLAGIGAVAGNLVVSPDATLAPAGTNTTIGYTLGANATGGISATNNIVLNGTTTIKLNGSGMNDTLQAGGSITYGGTLNLANINAAPLASGDTFQIFNAASRSGSFTAIVPATPGAGLTWDLSQLSLGKISVAGAGAQPTFTGTSVSGGNFIFSGSGGLAGGTYYVLTSTDAAAPLTNWIPIATNLFDGGGNFSFTNAVSADAQRFFILQIP